MLRDPGSAAAASATRRRWAPATGTPGWPGWRKTASWTWTSSARCRLRPTSPPPRSKRIGQLAARVTTAVSVSEVVAAVIAAGAEELQADNVTVYLLDEAGAHLHLASSEPVVHGTVDERNKRYPALLDHPCGANTVITVPLVLPDGSGIGVISIGWADPQRATADAVEFAKAVATLCAQSIRRAEQHDLQRRAHLSQRFLSDATRLISRGPGSRAQRTTPRPSSLIRSR